MDAMLLNHVPVVAAAGLLYCYCGWTPRPGDNSLACHIRLAARVTNMTLHLDGERVAHLRVGPGRAHRVIPHPDLDRITWAARSGDWATVAAMLGDLHEPASRDPRRRA